MSEEEIKNTIRERYGKLASNTGSCCAATTESCCSSPPVSEEGIPEEALQITASCGSPLVHVEVREGETVLDLGSGGGIDVFRASKLVGAKGRVIGLDATPQMIFRARETAKKNGFDNVEFRLGEIEHMPIESNTVDLVISNCVLNLVPDKESTFREIYRTLKPGGRISVSDMVATTQENHQTINLEEWAACIAGAVTWEEYRDLLAKAGFVKIEGTDESHPLNDEAAYKGRVKSVTWTATKPTSGVR